MIKCALGTHKHKIQNIAQLLSGIGVRASYQVPIHWNVAFTLTTETRLHMRSGIGAYGTAFGVSMDTVSHFVSGAIYRSLLLGRTDSVYSGSFSYKMPAVRLRFI
jgi:hypothetical protein